MKAITTKPPYCGPLATSAMIGVTLTTMGTVDAQPIIDRYVTINPIQVCNDSGTVCAPTPLFANETAKIYAQAGVASVFLPTTQLNDSSLLSGVELPALDQPGNGQHPNSTTVNMWFVQSLPAPPGSILFGQGWINANGVVINGTDVQNFNGGVGRPDTVAHELGHNFGLGHNTFGAGGAANLMTAGSVRSVPSSINDITPDGANLSQLTMNQINQIRSSPLVNQVPEVVIDTNGSTPFDTNDFFLVDFRNGPAGVSLTSLTVDLTPVDAFFDPTNDAPVFVFPGGSGSPFQLSNLNGITAGNITRTGGTDGSQQLTLNFTPGSFTAGDSFRFGIDIDLFSMIDQFGATPEELIGTLFSFQFSDGFGSQAQIEDDLIASSIEPMMILPFTGQPSGGPPIPPGQIIDTPDPVSVAEPHALLTFASSLTIFGLMGWRRKRTGSSRQHRGRSC